jgi:hypothetical protein
MSESAKPIAKPAQGEKQQQNNLNMGHNPALGME